VTMILTLIRCFITCVTLSRFAAYGAIFIDYSYLNTYISATLLSPLALFVYVFFRNFL